MMPKAKSKGQELWNNFLSGGVGGFIGTVLNTPSDLIKSRIQNTTKVPGQIPKYRNTIQSLILVTREEGFRTLYNGFTPKVLRLAPGGGVLLLVVEVVLEQWRNFLGPPYK